MRRAIKINIICPIDIDDDVDLTNETELSDALSEAVCEDLFSTNYLGEWTELQIEDIGKWED